MLKQIKLPKLLHTCAPITELPYNIGFMYFSIFSSFIAQNMLIDRGHKSYNKKIMTTAYENGLGDVLTM